MWLYTTRPPPRGSAARAALVAAAVAETGAESPKQMGLVMKVLTPRIAGRADGGRVAAAVKQALGG